MEEKNVKDFIGFDNDEQKQFDQYVSGLGYCNGIYTYEWYDGPLISSLVNEKGNIYISFAGGRDFHGKDSRGSEMVHIQCELETLKALHNNDINIVEAFDRGFEKFGLYLSEYGGIWNEDKTEVLNSGFAWHQDYDAKRSSMFNLSYLKDVPNAYHVDMDGVFEKPEFDIEERINTLKSSFLEGEKPTLK